MGQVPWWKEPTRAQWCAFGAAWGGWVLDAFDFTIFMLVMPNISHDFRVQAVATAGSITLTLFARLAGGFIAGAAADRWGRKLPLMISIVWFAACDGAVALAPSFGWILALRTLFGLGMGAEWTAGTTLAMENWPARSRGIASGVLQGSWAIGYLLAATVSAVVLPLWGWRALFVCAALPALMIIPIRFGIRESHEWAGARRASRTTIRPAIERRSLARLVWACLAMGLGFGAYYGLTALYPTVLRTELGIDARGVAWLVALFNVGMLVGSVACGMLASRRGVGLAIVAPALLSVVALPLYVGLVPGLLGVGAFAGGALGRGLLRCRPDVSDRDVPRRGARALRRHRLPRGRRPRGAGSPGHRGSLPGRAHRPGDVARSRRGRLRRSRSPSPSSPVVATRRHPSLHPPSCRFSKPPERDPKSP